MWRNPSHLRTVIQVENRDIPFALRLLSEGLDYKKSMDTKRWEAERNDVMSTYVVALLLTTLDRFHF